MLTIAAVVATPVGPRAMSAPTTWWVPPPATSWQWQLTGPLDLSVNAVLFDVDLFDTPATTVSALHSRGRRAICYLSAGTWEDWRPDADRFPESVLGAVVDGWPDERWLDIRRLDLLAPIMEARLDLCRQKGFDGVEPDNVDGYANRSGSPLSAQDQLRYNRWFAQAAHARGLSVGLKNDLDQIPQLVESFDWALVEQCFQYKECDRLEPFVAAGKAVFEVEYQLAASAFCSRASDLGFNALRKNVNPNAFREACSVPKLQPPRNVRIVK
jgi:hypothetical protein